MKNPLLITILLLMYILTGCSYEQQLTASFIQTLNKPVLPYNNPLLLNGVYSMTDCEDAYIMDSLNNLRKDGFIDPIIFYGNGVFTHLGYCTNYSIEKYQKIIKTQLATGYFQRWGVYNISDSLLKASIHWVFVGRGQSLSYSYLCNFEGIIEKNKILNWHMVEPYPSLSKLEQSFIENQIFLHYLKTPKEFTFKPFPEKTTVDSNAVWIMKYKNEK
jgi:hypothetical protein